VGPGQRWAFARRPPVDAAAGGAHSCTCVPFCRDRCPYCPYTLICGGQWGWNAPPLPRPISGRPPWAGGSDEHLMAGRADAGASGVARYWADARAVPSHGDVYQFTLGRDRRSRCGRRRLAGLARRWFARLRAVGQRYTPGTPSAGGSPGFAGLNGDLMMRCPGRRRGRGLRPRPRGGLGGQITVYPLMRSVRRSAVRRAPASDAPWRRGTRHCGPSAWASSRYGASRSGASAGDSRIIVRDGIALGVGGTGSHHDGRPQHV
jgi:hypothetical protein